MTSKSQNCPTQHAPRGADYDSFAPIYNRWMAGDFCCRALPVLDRLLLCELSSGAHVLDLCCGSGQFAQALTARGFRVTGIDASERMLRLARANAPQAEFVTADARNFRHAHGFHAALSTFNSLAHFANIAELTAVFCNVRSALLRGAAFLFDLSMEDAYASKWRDSFALVADDHACIVQPSYDPVQHIGTNRITVFEEREDGDLSSFDFEARDNSALSSRAEARNGVTEGLCAGTANDSFSRERTSNTLHLPLASSRWPLPTRLFRRSDFVITQTCHSESDLRIALAAAGFSSVQAFDAQRELGMDGEAGRTFFLCR